VTFFAAATYVGFFVLLAGAGLAFRAGDAPGEAVIRGAIGFGLVLVCGYVADVVVMSAPLRPKARVTQGPLIKTITALSEGASGTPGDDDNNEQQLAA
jgi:hypothetical protein